MSRKAPTYPGGRSKLSDTQIAEVRTFARERELLLDRLRAISNEELARVYNVSPTTISACINYYYSYRNNHERKKSKASKADDEVSIGRSIPNQV